ncbi:MAG: VCBS repeat-containing protein [Pirellulaceae bacterium]
MAEQLEPRLLLTVSSALNHFLVSGNEPIAAATGIVDSDPTIDLLAISADGQMLVALNGGNDAWANSSLIDLGTGPLNGFTAGRINTDPFLDFVAQGDSELQVFHGDGTGGFSRTQTLNSPMGTSFATNDGRPVQMTLAPINSDVTADLLTVSPDTNELLYYFGQPDGSFADAARYDSGRTSPVATIVGQFIGDLRPDVAVGHADGSITFFESDGQQLLFRSDLTIHGLGSIHDLAALDADRDGDLDLVVSGGTRMSSHPMERQSIPAAPAISATMILAPSC